MINHETVKSIISKSGMNAKEYDELENEFLDIQEPERFEQICRYIKDNFSWEVILFKYLELYFFHQYKYKVKTC